MNKGCGITLGVFLLVASLGLGYYFYKQSVKSPFVYRTVKPETKDIVLKAVATGVVKPRHEVQIKPQVSGVVEVLYVKPGQSVRKGQKIAKIKLVPSQVNINTAQSNVELARIRLRDAQRELERQRQINESHLDIEESRLAFENAKQELERQKELFNDGIISEQAFNVFKLELDLKKATFKNTEIQTSNNLKQLISDAGIRSQELKAAEDNLALLIEGASKNSRQVANIVSSTVEGIILDIPVEEGASVIERNNFNEGTTIAVVANMKSLIFEGLVDESDVGKMKEGMPLELTIGAIEDEKIYGTLEYISPKGVDDEGSVKFEIRAGIQQREDIFLRAGYSANADIILNRREQTLAIKERDLIIENDSTWVEVSVGDQLFEKRSVSVGLSDGVQIEVLSGIDTTTYIKMIRQPS